MGSRVSRTASSAFSLLSTPVGEDCAGAVRFASPDEVDRILRRPGHVAWLSDDGVAERLRELREDSTAWLDRSFTGRFSLAGAQAKTALLFRDGRWGAPSGSTPTTHTLKPAVSGLDDHDLNEHLCLDAARRAGLLAVRTSVSRFGDETAVVVTRYDRRAAPGSEMLRVHQEDLCQALGVPPSRKYQNEGGAGPAQIARLLREAMPPAVAEESAWRFNPWPAAAPDLGLDAGALIDRVRELATIAPDAFANAVSAPEIAALERDLPDKLLDLVADRATRCSRLLALDSKTCDPDSVRPRIKPLRQGEEIKQPRGAIAPP